MDEIEERTVALGRVVGVYQAFTVDPPCAAELIALAEWVQTGSISVATALEGQKAALFGDYEGVTEDEGGGD
jgi:hypothetical protein